MRAQTNMDIDVGLLPMLEEGCLPEADVEALRATLVTELRAAFAGRTARSSKAAADHRPFPITINADPLLHGYWGEDTVMTAP